MQHKAFTQHTHRNCALGVAVWGIPIYLGSQVCVRNSGLREAGLEHDSQSYLDDHEIYVARLYVDEICTRASSPVIVNRLPKQHRQGIIANSQTP